MEGIDIITGTELKEIRKKTDGITLRFQDRNARHIYTVTFKGWLLETSVPALGLRVANVYISNSPGFRAINQLRSADEDIKQYRQLFIQMENTTEDKAELIGVFKQYKMKKTSAELATDKTSA